MNTPDTTTCSRVTTLFLQRLMFLLDEAGGIARIALAICEGDELDGALKLAMDIKEPVPDANRQLEALLALSRLPRLSARASA